MKIHKEKKRYIAENSFSEKELLKDVGFIFDFKGIRRWWTNDPRKVARLLKISSDVQLESNIVEEISQAQKTFQAAIESSYASKADIEVPSPEGLTYLPFQKAGIKYILEREATLLGDEMGLGKTIQVAGVLNADPTLTKVLVICPKNARLVWRNLLGEWLTRPMPIGLATGQEWPLTDIVVINYDILGNWVEMILGASWSIVVADEIHYIKNPKTKRTKRTTQIFKQAPKRVGLTGTPIVNRPIELFPILKALDPGSWTSYWKYAQRYCDAHNSGWGWDVSGASNLDELQEKLRSTIMIRRLKSEVMKELPPKFRQIVPVPPNGLEKLIEAENVLLDKQLEETKALSELIQTLDPKVSKKEYADAVVKLKQLELVHFEEMAKLRHTTALAKVPYVAEHIAHLFETVEQIVLFGWHRDVLEALKEELKDYTSIMLIGGASDKVREEAEKGFQAGKYQLFIGNILAAGIAITLTASSTVVFAELDWVPGNMTQAEDRCHRIGQHDNVLVQHVVLDGSMDARLAKVLIEKQKVLDAALGAGGTLEDDWSENPSIYTEYESPNVEEAAKEVVSVPVKEVKEVGKIEKHVAGAAWTKEQLKELLQSSDLFVGKCLIKLFERQTLDEQANKGTKHLNSVGFNSVDAKILSSFASQFKVNSFLSPKQLQVARNRLNKYVGQLLDVANS